MATAVLVTAMIAAWWLTLRWAVRSGAFHTVPAPRKRTFEEIRALMTSYDAGSLTIAEVAHFLRPASPGEHMTWTYGDQREQAGFIATTCPDGYAAAVAAVNRRHLGSLRMDQEVPQA